MELAGSAIGIASLGITVCQGLLTYYDGWKAYESDITNTYESIADLSRTLTLLKASLEGEGLDEERANRVKRCLQSCEAALERLSTKAQKLRKHGQPGKISQIAWSEMQRLWYPFRASTLAKLREVSSDVQDRLGIAVQMLQLDVGQRSQKVIVVLDKRTSKMEASLTAMQQSAQFGEIVKWLSPPDPWTNHSSARSKHEPTTGAWLLQSGVYRSWKSRAVRNMWLFGKAGCGKTVLCSTVIEDVQTYCEGRENVACSMFYFSFSDNRKQTSGDLIRSLIFQLGCKEPGLSILQQTYDKSKQAVPGIDVLENVLVLLLKSYKELFLVLDALDESPEDSGIRRDVLDLVERLAQGAANLSILATSREIRDVRETMNAVKARPVPIAVTSVDEDISSYVSTQLSRDRTLCRLNATSKQSVMDTISQKADGMFRWADCQLQELKKLKSFRPSIVEKTLSNLPATLDETYARMLTSIDEVCRKDAITLLQWLAYAKSPPSLGELVDAVIIDLSDDSVNVDDRGSLEDALDLLSGLVTTNSIDNDDDNVDDDESYKDSETTSQIEDANAVRLLRPAKVSTRVRLAHFSVKEYLESTRILETDAKCFYLQSAKAHSYLAQSCLTYLIHYSSDAKKLSTTQDLATYLLLEYAAKSWFYHSSLQQNEDVLREMDLFSSDAIKDWLMVHTPDELFPEPFVAPSKPASSLYYASFLGLQALVEVLLNVGFDVNAKGGKYDFPLHAAIDRGHDYVVRLLLYRGANIDIFSEKYGTPLQIAIIRRNEAVAQLLISAGADVNALGGVFPGNALHAASFVGSEDIVQTLLHHGADVNIQSGDYGNALQAASYQGSKTVVQMLLHHGADVNTQGGDYYNALQAASCQGYVDIMALLVEHGAAVNAQGGSYFGNALQAAADSKNVEAVKILIDRGADVNADAGDCGYALQVASLRGFKPVVQLLLDRGAKINAPGGTYGSALQAAAVAGDKEVVEMLIDAGADVNADAGYDGCALQAASLTGIKPVVQLLLDSGAEINAQGGPYGNALQAAAVRGNKEVVEMLIDAGADISLLGGTGDSALQAASWAGYEDIVQILMARGADVNAAGGNRGTALHRASRRGRREVVQILLDHGADSNVLGPDGTALQIASGMGHKEVVKILLEQGADVNALGPSGTALHRAASRRGRRKVVQILRILLDYGADVHVVGPVGTVLETALSRHPRSRKIEQMLLDAGAGDSTLQTMP